MSIIDTILGRGNKAPVPVATPEWPDVELFVRRLSPQERVEFDTESVAQKANNGVAFVTFAVAFCTVARDSDGAFHRAFANGDWQALAGDPGSGSAIDRLFDAADELNALSSAARERLKKKSAAAASSGSICESPAP